MEVATLSIARDFSATPGGRFIKHGPDSGELFRKNYLTPRLRKSIAENKVLEVSIDDVAGYAGSFLEEAFGGLVRTDGFSRNELSQHLRIVSKDPIFDTYCDLANSYIRDAKPEA